MGIQGHRSGRKSAQKVLQNKITPQSIPAIIKPKALATTYKGINKHQLGTGISINWKPGGASLGTGMGVTRNRDWRHSEQGGASLRNRDGCHSEQGWASTGNRDGC